MAEKVGEGGTQFGLRLTSSPGLPGDWMFDYDLLFEGALTSCAVARCDARVGNTLAALLSNPANWLAFMGYKGSLKHKESITHLISRWRCFCRKLSETTKEGCA